MATSWFTLAVILYIISEIIAVPLRITPQENEYFSLDKNLESGLPEQRIRIRRAEDVLPAGCEKGSAFGLANVPHCRVTNAKYNPQMKLCLVELLHVPGMPDGNKGYNYVALNHFLYKIYNATNRLDIVKCPTAKSTPTVSLSTTPSTTKSGTKPETTTKDYVEPFTTISTAKAAAAASIAKSTSGNSPSTVPNQVVAST